MVVATGMQKSEEDALTTTLRLYIGPNMPRGTTLPLRAEDND